MHTSQLNASELGCKSEQVYLYSINLLNMCLLTTKALGMHDANCLDRLIVMCM